MPNCKTKRTWGASAVSSSKNDNNNNNNNTRCGSKVSQPFISTDVPPTQLLYYVDTSVRLFAEIKTQQIPISFIYLLFCQNLILCIFTRHHTKFECIFTFHQNRSNFPVNPKESEEDENIDETRSISFNADFLLNFITFKNNDTHTFILFWGK